MNEPDLEKAVVEKLSEVIDPETGVDVMKMRLVQDIEIDAEGKITYVFRPSSPLCPIAVPLALAIIDPETGVDVMKMRLVQDIKIDTEGKTTYVFRPSSPLCPIAVPLALAIIDAIKEVPGITGQEITVKDYSQADQLNEILKTIV